MTEVPALDARSLLPLDARSSLARLGAGVALILFAVVLYAGSRWIAGRQSHAYDPGASPATTYPVTAGRTYELSSATSVKRLMDSGALSTLACTWSADGQVANQLALTGTLADERNLHQFALFTAPITGSIQVKCTDVPSVFIDDADDTAPDWAATLIILTVLVAVTGAVLAVAGGYPLTEAAEQRNSELTED